MYIWIYLYCEQICFIGYKTIFRWNNELQFRSLMIIFCPFNHLIVECIFDFCKVLIVCSRCLNGIFVDANLADEVIFGKRRIKPGKSAESVSGKRGTDIQRECNLLTTMGIHLIMQIQYCLYNDWLLPRVLDSLRRSPGGTINKLNI